MLAPRGARPVLPAHRQKCRTIGRARSVNSSPAFLRSALVVLLGRAVAVGGAAVTVSGHGGDAQSGPGARPIPRRPSTLWLPSRQCGATPQRGPRTVGAATASARTRSGDRPTIAWIFGQRLAGHSVAAIARTLNDQGVPCPSIMDPARNRQRRPRPAQWCAPPRYLLVGLLRCGRCGPVWSRDDVAGKDWTG